MKPVTNSKVTFALTRMPQLSSVTVNWEATNGRAGALCAAFAAIWATVLQSAAATPPHREATAAARSRLTCHHIRRDISIIPNTIAKKTGKTNANSTDVTPRESSALKARTVAFMELWW